MVATHRLLFNTPPYPARVGSVKSKAVVVQKPCAPEAAVSGSVVVVPGFWLLDRQVLKSAFGASSAGRWSAGFPGGQAPPLSAAFSPGCRLAFLDQKEVLPFDLISKQRGGRFVHLRLSLPSLRPFRPQADPFLKRPSPSVASLPPLAGVGERKARSFTDLGRSRVATLRSLSSIASFEVLGMGRVVTPMSL